MNIVDNFINRFEIMSSCLNKLEEKSEKNIDRSVAFDPNAEFDFDRSAESQHLAD